MGKKRQRYWILRRRRRRKYRKNKRKRRKRDVAKRNFLEKFHTYLQRRYDDLNKNDTFRKSFHKLDGIGTEQSTEIAKLPANMSKNRYRKVLPFDKKRVILMHGKDGSDYINASNVDFPNQKFIASQGPTEDTKQDFWEMIVQKNTKYIIMLTNLVEKKRTKCSQYWPEQSQATLHLGNMTIKHQNTEVYSTYVIRFFSIEVDGDIRNVVQFHYTAWPDHDVPKLEKLLDFCRVVLSHTNRCNVPVVVHCSAGVGRTGTWIALMRLIRQVIVVGKKVDIDDVIRHMRMCRNFMVMRTCQYKFLFESLLYMLKKELGILLPVPCS